MFQLVFTYCAVAAICSWVRLICRELGKPEGGCHNLLACPDEYADVYADVYDDDDEDAELELYTGAGVGGAGATD